MTYAKVIIIGSLIISVVSISSAGYLWTRYQRANNTVLELDQKVANYHALLYTEMETCRTILGCFVKDQSFCATDAYPEKLTELGRKSEEFRTKIGDEVSIMPNVY